MKPKAPLPARPELDALIAAAVAVVERMSPEERAAMWEAQRQSWARGEAGLRETSASPPRVPGASAHVYSVGVESGPGQPMTDICERLGKIRSMIGKMCSEGRPPAMTIPADPSRDEDLFIADTADEAAAEIRRLREAAEYWKERHEEVSTVQVTTLTKVREAGDWEGFRRGIEAAAHRIETFTFSTGLHAYTVSAVKNVLSQVVRALADAHKSEGG